jgi:hypothetical protein
MNPIIRNRTRHFRRAYHPTRAVYTGNAIFYSYITSTQKSVYILLDYYLLNRKTLLSTVGYYMGKCKY